MNHEMTYTLILLIELKKASAMIRGASLDLSRLADRLEDGSHDQIISRENAAAYLDQANTHDKLIAEFEATR